MKKIRCLIIDDELPARKLLRHFLKDRNDIEITGEADNGFDAVKMIDEQKPDLIFLDVKMPKLNGFEVLELIQHSPSVIFTTAFDNFAIKAFEENATDYLLKPFSKSRLENSLLRIEKKNTKSDHRKIISYAKPERLVVKEANSVKVVAFAEIISFLASDDYVIIKTKQGEYIKKQTLSYYEENLPKELFMRIHRSVIINISEIKSFDHISKENYEIKTNDNSTYRVSKSYIKDVKKIFNS